MPKYDQLLTEPSSAEHTGATCPFKGLSRNLEVLWYVRTMYDYSQKFEKFTGDLTKSNITLIEWEDAIRVQLLFQRVMPEREL